MQIRIKPKCWPVNENGERDDSLARMPPAFSANGYFFPCCWMEKTEYVEKNIHNLFDEELKITNIESVDEVFNSEQWKKFYMTMLFDPNNICDVCKIMCGVVIDHNEEEHEYWKWIKK